MACTRQPGMTQYCTEAADAHQRISDLERILACQVAFTEKLRAAAILAVAHASHIGQNYCRDVPEDKLSEWASAQVEFNALSIAPSPARYASAAIRDGAVVN